MSLSELSNRTVFVVCYDISNNKRLTAVRKILVGFGEPLQFSVFRCALTAAELVVLRDKLAETIHAREDRVLFADLGPASGRGDQAITTLGQALTIAEFGAIVV